MGDRITYGTSHVFCLVKCPFGFCYVGKKKREFKGKKIRISEHKSSSSNRDERPPVARHFNSAGHGVCKRGFMVIEAVRPPLRGGDRESHWMHYLQTEYPNGVLFLVNTDGYY